MENNTELREVKTSTQLLMQKRRRDAFRRKYKTDDPNFFDSDAKKTIFEKILRTPKSKDDIRWCIENGADMYSVSSLTSSGSTDYPSLLISFAF